MSNRVLKFANLPDSYTKELLSDKAKQFGEVESVAQSKQTGEVRFKSAEHAKAAFDSLKAEGLEVKLESVSGSWKVLFLLLVLAAAYYFGARKYLFDTQRAGLVSVPKDAAYSTPEASAHYPRYKLTGNTLENFVKGGTAKSRRDSKVQESSKGKKQEEPKKGKKSKKATKESAEA